VVNVGGKAVVGGGRYTWAKYASHLENHILPRFGEGWAESAAGKVRSWRRGLRGCGSRRCGGEQAYVSVGALAAGVGQAVLDGVEDELPVPLDRSHELGERFEPAALRPGDPADQQRLPACP
jgi:hypothetical protein